MRTGTNHYSSAFTDDWLASEHERQGGLNWCIWTGDDDGDAMRPIMWPVIQVIRHEGGEWPIRWKDKL